MAGMRVASPPRIDVAADAVAKICDEIGDILERKRLKLAEDSCDMFDRLVDMSDIASFGDGPGEHGDVVARSGQVDCDGLADAPARAGDKGNSIGHGLIVSMRAGQAQLGGPGLADRNRATRGPESGAAS